MGTTVSGAALRNLTTMMEAVGLYEPPGADGSPTWHWQPNATLYTSRRATFDATHPGSAHPALLLDPLPPDSTPAHQPLHLLIRSSTASPGRNKPRHSPHPPSHRPAKCRLDKRGVVLATLTITVQFRDLEEAFCTEERDSELIRAIREIRSWNRRSTT